MNPVSAVSEVEPACGPYAQIPGCKSPLLRLIFASNLNSSNYNHLRPA